MGYDRIRSCIEIWYDIVMINIYPISCVWYEDPDQEYK